MSITKNDNYPGNLEVSTRYQRIIQDPGTGYIIIDDIVTPGESEAHTEINRGTAWLRVEANYQITVLSAAPAGLAIIDAYASWSETEILAQANEVFVVEHTGLPMSAANQKNIVGYSFGAPGDVITIKIDQAANTVTLYRNNGHLV
ncbi:MAG TPA: hypothetical protein PKL15_00635 [Saprospiraceae bacterium]|nr:hypothetical protein [Saprospiraceae bacterium]HNM23893.1 hypothetical protein [Saprospiraceae bacterium]